MSTKGVTAAVDPDERALSITDAGTPFDHPDADVILRSIDNVNFRVFKLLLSISSPFFKDMFALPQVPDGINSNETKGGLPIITVTEESKTLERLLLLCYPADIPALDVLEDVQALLDSAIKYSVKRAEKKARECLIAPRFINSAAMRVLAIACRYRLQEEVKVAAMSSFNRPLPEQIIEGDLEYITSTQLFRLMQYHERCAAAVKIVATDFSWIQRTYVWEGCRTCHDGHLTNIRNGRKVYRPSWWINHMHRVAAALTARTWGMEVHMDLTNQAVQEAALCKGTCWEGQGASVEMQVFMMYLNSEIQRVITEIPLDLQL